MWVWQGSLEARTPGPRVRQSGQRARRPRRAARQARPCNDHPADRRVSATGQQSRPSGPESCPTPKTAPSSWPSPFPPPAPGNGAVCCVLSHIGRVLVDGGQLGQQPSAGPLVRAALGQLSQHVHLVPEHVGRHPIPAGPGSEGKSAGRRRAWAGAGVVSASLCRRDPHIKGHLADQVVTGGSGGRPRQRSRPGVAQQ